MGLDDLLASRNSALTVEEVADILSVSRRLVYDLVSKGEVPYFRVGSAVRFEPKRLASWLQSNLRAHERKAQQCGRETPHRAYIGDPGLSGRPEGDMTAFWEEMLLPEEHSGSE